MDVFNFCWVTLLNESKRCSVFFDKNTCKVTNKVDQNFAKPVTRIAYLYKFGSFNVSFFYRCFEDFFTKVADSSKIVDEFLAIKHLNVCSMSAGPGTDIIGLLYSLFMVQKPLINAATFRVISRDGNWRYVVSGMINSSIINVPEGSACHLIGCNFLKKLSNKAQNYLKAADILLMCDSFSATGYAEKNIYDALKTTIQLLKPGALVFLIFSKEKSNYFKELDSFGCFLFGPVEIILENMPYNEQVAELVGVNPLCSGTSMFALWQKFNKVNPEINLGKETESHFSVWKDQEPIASNYSRCDLKDINSPILSMSELKGEFSSDTNVSSRSNSIPNSTQFSSNSISSQIIKKKDKSLVTDSTVNFNAQNIEFSKVYFHSPGKNASLVPNVSGSFILKNNVSCESSNKKEENLGNDMNSLLENLESLIYKFERLISSRNSSKNSQVKEKQSLCGQHCHENLPQGYYIKPHQFNGNSSFCCCHSMVCCDHVATHSCSLNAANNLYRTLPQEYPCIVIPLQNLSGESLTSILPIVSKNFPSVTK